MTRNEAREIIMQIVYELDASDEMNVEKATSLCEERLAGNHRERGSRLLGSMIENLDRVDGMINACSTRWKTSRMPKVDLAIMRLAVSEMLFDDDIPDAVAVNEAINMAKKYSTDNSAGFIHGVLGAISNRGDKGDGSLCHVEVQDEQ